jgi:hypothetical protein
LTSWRFDDGYNGFWEQELACIKNFFWRFSEKFWLTMGSYSFLIYENVK